MGTKYLEPDFIDTTVEEMSEKEFRKYVVNMFYELSKF